MGFLTSTLGYLIPPPRLPAEKYYQGKSLAKIRSSQAQSSLKDNTFDSNKGVDEIDCGLNEVKFDEAEPHTSVNKSCQEVITADDVNFWVCFRFLVSRDLFIFFCQVVLVFILVLFSSIRLVAVPELSCEERTAYTMIISTCIAYLLPNADSLQKSNNSGK